MPTILTDSTICEKSTAVITVSFSDEDGNAVAPDSMTWTLTDRNGNVINSRQDVVLSSPTSTEVIVLSGDDLQIVDSDDDGVRILTFEGTYTSALGSGLPLVDACSFVVENLKAVT
jgi:hypothetical protein